MEPVLNPQESEGAVLLSASIHHSLSLLCPMPGWTEEDLELEWAQPPASQRWVFNSVCFQQLLQWCCRRVQSLKLRGFGWPIEKKEWEKERER